MVSRGMAWAHRVSRGFALAAVIADDKGAAQALCGLTDGARSTVAGVLEHMATLQGAERRRELRSMAEELRPLPPGRDLIARPRVRALLAPDVERDVGVRWLSEAPAVRRDYRSPPGLRASVRRAAASAASAAHASSEADTERGLGRLMLAQLAPHLDAAVLTAVLKDLGAEEAGAVVALRQLLAPSRWDAGVVGQAHALLDVALQVAAGPELTRVLGAMKLGADADGSEISLGQWRRTGEELGEVGLRVPCPG